MTVSSSLNIFVLSETLSEVVRRKSNTNINTLNVFLCVYNLYCISKEHDQNVQVYSYVINKFIRKSCKVQQ